MKFFVLFLVVLLFVLWKKNKARQQTWGERFNETLQEGLFKRDPFSSMRRGSGSGSDSNSSSGGVKSVDELIACAVCGLHTPKSQLVIGKNQRYQCAKHQ